MNEKSDEWVQELGASVLMDASYDDYDWESISVVFDLSETKSVFGYVYLKDGHIAEESPSDGGLLEMAQELRVSMYEAKPEQGDWLSILLQLVDDDGEIRINIHFNYDEPQKWHELAGDLDKHAEQLHWKASGGLAPKEL